MGRIFNAYVVSVLFQAGKGETVDVGFIVFPVWWLLVGYLLIFVEGNVYVFPELKGEITGNQQKRLSTGKKRFLPQISP